MPLSGISVTPTHPPFQQSSTKAQSSYFVLSTAVISIFLALPCSSQLLFVFAQVISDQAALFYGPDAEFTPPAYASPEDYANITAVPLRGWRRSEYYSDSKPLPYPPLANPSYHFVASGHIVFVTLFLVFFGVGPKFSILALCLGTYAASVVYLGGLHSVIIKTQLEIGGEDEYSRGVHAKFEGMFSFAFPLGLIAVSGLLTVRKLKSVLLFFVLCLFICDEVLSNGIQFVKDHFFRSGAGLLEKVAVKFLGMGLLSTFWIEVSWQVPKVHRPTL